VKGEGREPIWACWKANRERDLEGKGKKGFGGTFKGVKKNPQSGETDSGERIPEEEVA